MCGIIVYFKAPINKEKFRLKHRGPDNQTIETLGECTMEFTRLSINDMSHNGNQPFMKNNQMLVCNGEIYNHLEFSTLARISNSDCECLFEVFNDGNIIEKLNKIRGVFASVWTDGNRLIAARDPIGVRPLFYKKSESGGITLASEVKALGGKCNIFPPGHFYDSYLDKFTCYYSCYWPKSPSKNMFTNNIKTSFIDAIKKRITNTDRDVGFLLSGGLDSSLVASIANNMIDGPINTFSIGTLDSPDLLAARKMAKFLNSNHHEVIFDFNEGINNLSNVIYSLESYDTTTIRASTPMWLLCKWIKENTSCRVILSGEGSDEILGGYKYFKLSPDEDSFLFETQRRLAYLHQFDVLRSDRCMAAHGLEVCVPFLDRDFIDEVMNIDVSLKQTKEEKKILRDLFDDGTLPTDILRRPKDAFSDAVGYSWVDYIKKYADENISDNEYSEIEKLCGKHNIPQSKEEVLFRKVFWKHFGHENDHLIGEIWRQKWSNFSDPSARLIEIK